ncbi:hypothetical protein HQ531_09480 [bacterium]|nr:hypothetical protein [bacterium]
MPVIRLSPTLFKRLESYARGFDTPQNVIERLIELVELNQLHAKLNESTQEKGKTLPVRPRTIPRGVKKPRDPRKEAELKYLVGESLDWGKPNLSGSSVLTFSESVNHVLCKYSSFSEEQRRWFWGVSRRYWSEWDANDYLALLMENEDQSSYSFLLLNSKEALTLFDKCSESGGEKKINLRHYINDGKFHLQEWQDIQIQSRIFPLGGSTPTALSEY